MKNFRKVLALILVVATLFSFVAMASAKSAEDYTDYADVKYVEAVDVLTAIGITEGYDGAFHANDPIDRDEVAAMVARLRNGGTVNADLYVGADNVFADVKGQWSEGYVTYCAQLGIINGRNASTFDPDGKVTGTEVMKMLLCVLGYDAAEQGYTGANWQVNVVRDAAKAGLLIADVDPYKAATRDEVAQYFLNALNARMVIGYVGEGIVKISNSIWADISKETIGNWFEITTPDAKVNGIEVTYCNAVISGDYLYESIKGLKVEDGKEDCYKRPGYVWSYGDWSKFYADAPVATWTAASDADVKAAIKDNKLTIAQNKYFVDGAEGTSAYGNGVLVELYEDRVVVVNTYIDVVSDVSKYYGTFKLKNAGKTLKLSEYDVANDDVVLYWVCANGYNHADTDKDGIHDVKVITPVNVDVTAGDLYKNFNENVLYAGKEYKYAANQGNGIAEGQKALIAANLETSTNYNLYLDEYGYIMYWAVPTAEDTTAYAYLVEKTAFESYDGKLVGEAKFSYTADLVKFGADGALAVEEDASVDKAAYDKATARYKYDEGSVTENIGTLVKYKLDDKGNFVFVEEAEYAPAGAKLSATSWEIADDVYCTSKTVFMVRTMNLDGTYSYKQVTGYENLGGTYYAELVRAGWEFGLTNIQYFVDKDHTDFASYVFIDVKAQAADADHFLVLDKVEYLRWETALKSVYGKEYFIYDALVDGARALIASDKALVPGMMYDDVLSYYGFDTTLANGTTYELYVYADADTDARMGAVKYTYAVKDGEVYVKYYAGGEKIMGKLAADAKTYTVSGTYDSTEKTWSLDVDETILTIDEVKVGDDFIVGGYIYLNDDGEIAELYVVANDFFSYLFS